MEVNQESGANAIGERQNISRMLNLLRARVRMYTEIKVVQRIYFLIILALPAGSLGAVLWLAEAKPWISLGALIVGALDAMFIDSWRKRRIKTAARVQEEFDCEVLDIPWNKFTVGKKVTAEEISSFAEPPFSPKMEKKLHDWYPMRTRNLPIHVARLVCQRTNLWYDSQLRKTYQAALLVLAVVYFLCLLLFAWQFTVADFILVALVPFGPLFTWVVREHHRHGDTITLVDRLLAEIESSLEVFTQVRDSADAQARSRELQDAIFAHRASSPLVSNLVYRFKRTKLESQMDAGAQTFIDRVEQSMEEAA